MKWIVLALIAPCLFAAEFDKAAVEAAKKAQIEIDRGGIPPCGDEMIAGMCEQTLGPYVDPGEVVQIFPKACESKMYKWNGESLDCMTVDRLGILLAHKNLNFNAWRACTSEVVFLKNKAVVHAIHDDAREKCRVLGKRFDEDAVMCAGSLKEGDKP